MMSKFLRLDNLRALCVCSLIVLSGCEKPATEEGGAPPEEAKSAPARAEEAPANGAADGKAAYACPTIAAATVAAPVPAEQGLGFSFKIPEGFVWSAHQAPEHGAIIQIVRFELPFTNPSDKRHPERLAIVHVEQGPALNASAAPPLPKETIPYVMGSGGVDDAAAEALVAGKGLLAGELELGAIKAPILRQPTDLEGRFSVRIAQGDEVRDVTVRVFAAKTYPVVMTDQEGGACLADFDRVGLEIIKSIALNP